MSDHNPTILELTPPPREPALASVIALLRDKYDGQFRARTGEGAASHTPGGSIVLGDVEVTVSLDLPNVELDSRAWEAAWDVLRGRARRKGRKALTRLCVDVAAAAGAEGFRLRFGASSSSLPTVDTLVRALTSVDGNPGLILGISATSAAWPKVKDYYASWTEIRGYQVVSFP